MRAGAYRRSIKTGDVAARMGTQRARSRTPSVYFIVAVSPWRMADRYAPRGVQEKHQNGDVAARMGTQRARSRTPSVKIYRSCVPLAHGRQVCAPGRTGEASKRATLRRGWGHSGLDPELLRSRFIVAVSPWRMADRYAPRGVQEKHQNGRRCGADGDTAGSIPNSFGQIYCRCVPLAHGRQGCAPGRTGEASKRATLRRGWGHSGLDPELVRSRLIVAVSPWRMADRYAPRGVQEKHQNGRRCGADGDTAGSIPNSFGQDLS